MSEVLKKYYAQAVDHYDDVFLKPERLSDLAEIETKLLDVLEGHHVLELACGTGYWTERIAHVAESVLATDINQEMLDAANKKIVDFDNVELAIADYYDINIQSKEKLTACFIGLTWSHIKREDYLNVIAQCKKAIGAGGLLVLIDNNQVDGTNRPTVRTDSDSNTYQFRENTDGSRVEVVKSFPTDSFLRKRFAPVTKDLRIVRNEYFWMLTCVMR